MDYNKKYYKVALRTLQDMKYYYGDILGDCVKHLLRYFPDADKDELNHAVIWAFADAWGGGCEYEEM